MSKERDLLRKILSDTQYINYACNDKIRNEIVEFLAQPETCVCQERQFKLSEKCRELEIEIGQKEARMEVGMRLINEPNPQGIAQMAHMCSDAEYAAFRKRIGFDDELY